MVMYENRTEICQDFASAKNIKLEIRGLPELFMDPQFVTIRPSKKVFFAVQKSNTQRIDNCMLSFMHARQS